MSTPTGTERLQRVRRQLLTADDGTSRFGTSRPGEGEGAARWVAGLLAGLQGAILSLLVVVLPAVAAYVVTSADPSNAEVPWTRSLELGTGLWLLAHGVPLAVGTDVLTLVPLGLTLLALYTCHASARRSGYPTSLALSAGVGGYVVVAVVLSLLVRASVGHVVLAASGALVVSGIGLATGLARRPEAPPLRGLTRPLWSRVPAAVRAGVPAGVLAVALVLAAASLVTVLWVLAGRATIADVIEALDLDAVGGGVLALAELAFLPNLVVWAFTWLAGPGFHVGTGTTFTTAEVVPGPIPALPLLGALPQPDMAGGALVAAPALLVLAGCVAGWWLHRRTVPGRARDVLAAAAAAGLTAGACAAGFVSLASGAVGPGRMAEVGAAWAPVGGVVALGVALGALLVALPAEPLVRDAVRGVLRDRRSGSGARGGAERVAAEGSRET